MGFTLVSDYPYAKPSPHYPMDRRVRTLMICTKCDEAIIGIFERTLQARAPDNNPAQLTTDPQELGWLLRDTYPKGAPSKIPSHINDQLKSFFNQAAESARRQNWDASGAMS